MAMRFSICVLLFGLIANAQDRPLGAGSNLYSREKEIAIGASLAQDLQRTSKPLDSPAALEFVQRVGAKLAAGLPEPRFPYVFTLIANDESNAIHEPLSFPGGRIFVPASLFAACQDEAEFAAMLAHAMGHVAARHGTRAESRNQIAQMGTIPMIFMGGWQGFGARQAAATVIPVSLMRSMRDFEREADAIAIQLTSKAGYDPQALVNYMTREWPVNPIDRDRDPRIAAAQGAIQKLNPTSSDDEFLRIRRQVQDLLRN